METGQNITVLGDIAGRLRALGPVQNGRWHEYEFGITYYSNLLLADKSEISWLNSKDTKTPCLHALGQ